MMTGMERLGALRSGKLPDRVPFVCNVSDQGAFELGVSLKNYYMHGETVAEGQFKLREKYGFDTLLGIFYSALETEVLGSRNIIYAEDGPPNVGELIIKSTSDIDKLKVPENPESNARFAEVLKCVSTLKAKSQGKYPVIGAVTASFSLPAMLMGIGPWMELFLAGDPALRNNLLSKCSEFCRMEIASLRNAGADLIVYANPVASATVITAHLFRQIALEWVIRDLEPVGYSGIVYFNGGGKINPMLASLKENTELQAFYLNPFDDIIEARRILGDGCLIAGAINDIHLIDYSSEKIEIEVKHIMEEGKNIGGFIFGTLMMPYKIPEKNIRILSQAVEKYGRY